MDSIRDSFPFYQYGFCVLGILISIILPVLRRLLPKPALFGSDFTAWKLYGAIGLFSLITAVMVIAFGKTSVSTWHWFDALLAGYAWDSTLQKLATG